MDTSGLLLAVTVLPANIVDRHGAEHLLKPLAGVFPRLSLIWADMAYQGAGLSQWTWDTLSAKIEITRQPSRRVYVEQGQRPEPKESTFKVIPRRWVVERTFAWQGRNRRLAKDYEGLPKTEETFVYLAMVILMARRLAL